MKYTQQSSFAKFFALSFGLVAASLSPLGSQSSQAANDVWIGNTNANFATLANWTGSVNPSGNTPTFGVAGSSGTTLNNDLTGASFTGLTFNSGASAFTIGGNSFTLTGNITNSSSSLQTINNNITLTGNRTLAGGAGGLTLGGTTTHTQTTTGAGLVITGTVNSAGSFTEDGGAANNAGYLSIGGNNTLNVTSGTFSVLGTTNATKSLSTIGQNAAGTSTLNVSGGNLVIGSEAGFALANASTGTGVLTISSGTATINRGTTATTTNTVDTRMIMMGRAPTSAGGNTGTINLNGGTLATDRQFVRNGSSGGTAGIANFVFGGGTLKALGTQTDWLQSTTASDVGQNQGVTGGTVNTNALALSSVTTTAVSTIDSNGFSVAINSAISGAGGFKIISSSGTGTVTFGGANSYTAATTVTAGTLSVSSLADGGSNSNIGAAANTADKFILNGGTLKYTGAAVSTDRLFSLQSSSTIDASGSGAVNFTNTGSMGFNSGTAAKTLTLTGTNTGANTIAAVIGDNTGATSVTKSGAGAWVLSGANSYTGATTISSGTLAITGTGALGGTSLVNIAGGATLGYTGAAATFAKNVTITSGTGTISNTGSGILGLSGTLTKLDKTLALSGNFNVTGKITGTSSPAFDSDLAIVSGTTTISGTSNDYYGATNVSSGATLVNGNNNVLPTSTVINLDGTYNLGGFSQQIAGLSTLTGSAGTITNSGTSTLTVNNDNSTSNSDYTYSGVIADGSGKTSLTKTGNRTLTLTGSSSYSGGTTLTSGTLVAGNNYALGSGVMTLDGGTVMSNTDTRILSNSIVVTTAGGQVSGATDLEFDGAASGAGTLTVNVNATHKVKINPTTGDSFAPGRFDVHSGTLLLGGANKIGNTTNVALSGGTFATGGNNETVNTLTMSGSSTLDLGSSGTVHFADSSSQTWSGTLSIWNWVGSVTGGGTTQLFFGSSSSGLTSGQLGSINIYGDGGATFLGNGSLLGSGELVPIPEPATIIGALAFVGLIVPRERRRLSVFRNLSKQHSHQ